jgi:hypothetical protein
MKIARAPGGAAQDDVRRVAAHFAHAFARAERRDAPYRHWLLDNILPGDILASLQCLPVFAPKLGRSRGRRESFGRTFLTPALEALDPAIRIVAETFQHPSTIRDLEAVCGVLLRGCHLRIEYCQDREGFWLEPHTDDGTKRLALRVYLSGGPNALDWGTDLFEGPRVLADRVPFGLGKGLCFAPGAQTWHGFRPRPIIGIRRSLAIDYVTRRAEHEELAFPDEAIL